MAYKHLSKDGEKAQVRLALLEYGSGVVSAEAGFMQILTPLTADHTLVAQMLFATAAKGSEEFAGLAIDTATSLLKWTPELGDFKAIVIAGNESIKQGSKDINEAVHIATSKDIIVNPIFCGDQTIMNRGFGFPHTGNADPVPDPIYLEWKEVAKLGNGEILNINHEDAIPYIESPFDNNIVQNTQEFNKTYLPYGELGKHEWQRIIDLDGQIRRSGSGSYMDWGSYRSGEFSQAQLEKWDLVEAIKKTDFNLALIKESDLPEILKDKSLVEKLAIIKSYSDKREHLKEQIASLQAKRRAFVDEYLVNNQSQNSRDFNLAFKEIIVKQLEAGGFTLE